MPVRDVIFGHRWLIAQQAMGNLDYVVAWREDNPLGRGTILWHGYVIPELAEEFPQTPVIRSVEVKEEFRGIGIGTSIVRELEQRAFLFGFTAISLGVMPDNTLARRLWRRLGYAEWDRGVFRAVSRYDGCHGEDIVRHEEFIPMRKVLVKGS
jgi:ribosomal protein S18 acetylase RimI-like enzyme